MNYHMAIIFYDRTGGSMSTQAASIVQTILAWAGGATLFLGAAGTISFQLFKHFGEKWLDSKFDERLQQLRHAHNTEIERLRFQISTQLDRVTKHQQKEFEILPTAWEMLNDAFWATEYILAALREYPDLRNMSEGRLEDFLAQAQFSEPDKEELRNSRDRNATYAKFQDWREFVSAQRKTQDGRVFLVKNGIFIHPEILTKFDGVYQVIVNALVEHQCNLTSVGAPRIYEAIRELTGAGKKQLNELQLCVAERLRPAEGVLATQPFVPTTN